MPVRKTFEAGLSAAAANAPNLTEAVNTTVQSTTGLNQSRFYVAFISSYDPVAKQSWCSDVRASLPKLEATFAGENQPDLVYIHVGLRPEFKAADCVWRTKWGIHFVPTLVRYERVDGGLKESGRLVEEDVLDEKKFQEFMAS